MNTTISTTIAVELYEKIKQNRPKFGEKWAYNELIALGVKCIEEDWETQLKELVEGNTKLQAKLTDLNADITILKNKIDHPGEAEE
jgi:hypothetical protein